MKFVLVLPHAGYARNFEWVLELLARRGHSIDVVIDGDKDDRDLESLAAVVSSQERITIERAPARPRGGTRSVAVGLRLLLDYLRYLDPSYARAEMPRKRIESIAPGARWLGPRLRARPRLRLLVASVLERAERQAKASREIVALLQESRADLIVVTPLVEPGSDQVEYVRAARSLRIPTILPVASWDNLTIKGGIHEIPDIVAVWNEPQRREAVELHNVPSDRVRITGAVAYDHWFETPPHSLRDAFCRTVGLDARCPYVVYAGSSSFIAAEEGTFALAWAEAVRKQMRELQILVRPHPSNALGRYADELSRIEGVVVSPAEGINPISADARRHYVDTIRHSAGVVGINTSALVEAAVAGRPAFAILDERFAGTQRGVLHFDHLLEGNGGALLVAADLAEHVDMLERVVNGGEPSWLEANRTFVARFVRPLGLHVPASPILADCMEALVLRGPSATRTHRGERLAGRAILLAAVPFAWARQRSLRKRSSWVA